VFPCFTPLRRPVYPLRNSNKNRLIRHSGVQIFAYVKTTLTVERREENLRAT
jgi:hypothetical protein